MRIYCLTVLAMSAAAFPGAAFGQATFYEWIGDSTNAGADDWTDPGNWVVTTTDGIGGGSSVAATTPPDAFDDVRFGFPAFLPDVNDPNAFVDAGSIPPDAAARVVVSGGDFDWAGDGSLTLNPTDGLLAVQFFGDLTINGPGVSASTIEVGDGEIENSLTVCGGSQVTTTGDFITLGIDLDETFTPNLVTVSGAGTLLDVGGKLSLGNSPTGGREGGDRLVVEDGASVQVAGDFEVTLDSTFEIRTGGSLSAGTATVTGNAELTLEPGTNTTIGLVTIQDGGVLNGRGNLTGAIDNAGVVSPGSSPGRIDITGSYIQQADGELQIEIAGTTPGSGYDQLGIDAFAALDGDLFVDLIDGFVLGENQTFYILDINLGTGSPTGTFAGLADDSVVLTDPTSGLDLFITYDANTDFALLDGGNDVALYTIPEPASMALVLFGLSGLLGRRAREVS
jgi:hypothetical protein